MLITLASSGERVHCISTTDSVIVYVLSELMSPRRHSKISHSARQQKDASAFHSRLQTAKSGQMSIKLTQHYHSHRYKHQS